jgi:hypothetical protein
MSDLRITGQLLADAYTSTTPQGHAYVNVQIGQGTSSVAAKARYCLGQGNGPQYAAAQAARRLRAGMRVTIHAAGYRIEHRPVPHLVLIGVDFIEHLQLPHPHHTPEAVEIELQPRTPEAQHA